MMKQIFQNKLLLGSIFIVLAIILFLINTMLIRAEEEIVLAKIETLTQEYTTFEQEVIKHQQAGYINTDEKEEFYTLFLAYKNALSEKNIEQASDYFLQYKTGISQHMQQHLNEATELETTRFTTLTERTQEDMISTEKEGVSSLIHLGKQITTLAIPISFEKLHELQQINNDLQNMYAQVDKRVEAENNRIEALEAENSDLRATIAYYREQLRRRQN